MLLQAHFFLRMVIILQQISHKTQNMKKGAEQWEDIEGGVRQGATVEKLNLRIRE